MHFKSFMTPLCACALAFLLGIGSLKAQSVANYSTTFSTTGSLMSMTGSTDIFATGTYRDDVASTVTNFPSGFSFVYMGTVYTQFSVNSNGQFRFGGSAIAGTNVTPTSSNALLAPMGGDNVILSSGKVHFLLTGTAPDRQFVVEWLDLRIPYAASPATGTGTQLQIVLNESNGSIEFRYGSVFNNGTSVSRSIFMSNGTSSVTNSKYINLAGPAESNTGTAVSNSLTDNAAVTGLNSAADGSRTVFTFTPISAPVAPSGISFTNVLSSSVTVNWADNSSNELGFLVERSTDGTNFTTVSTTAANATSLAITGLIPGTNYTIRVRAFNDGRFSTALTGTQTTNAISTYVWNQTGTADYATATNWTPNRTTPDPTDILEFSNGATTTVTGVTTQTIGRLLISGNTSVTLQSAATATLTIAGGTGTDLDIPAGSSLILGSANTFTLTHASSAGNTSSIAGTLTVNASNTYTSSTSANNITTVTGTLNNAGTINGATAALLMNSGSTYNHNFTTAGGTIPTATWDVASTVSFTTYTTNSSAPVGIGQSFGNFTWNCTAQTGNINFDNSSLVVRGTFTLAATNSGSVRFTGSTTRTVSFNNVTVSGGTLDFSSGTGVLTLRVFGTFNQSGGTITESGTGTGVIEFADTLGTSQNVTLGTINNTFRYIVSDVQGINLTGTMTIATNGSLIINTVAATPINGGTLVYGTAPTTLQYGNGTSGMAALTATAAIFPASSGPSNLTINNANGVNLGFSRTVTTLTMTSGNINLSGNTLTLGTSASAAGTLSYTAGLIQGGTFSRWFPTTGLPTSASTSIGYYPMGHNSNNRQVQLFFSTATALSTGGTISVTHNNVAGTSAITGFSDGAITVDRRTNSNWVIATGDGIAASGTISMAIRGDNTSSPLTVSELRLIRATDAVGTSSNGTGSSSAPVANRTAVSLTDLASTFHLGSTSSNLASIYTATSSGNWGDNATWDLGTTPTSNDLAIINSGVTVTVAGTTTPYNCLNLTVNGTLTANANSLTIGGTSANGLTITNGGTVNVGGGTINVGPSGGGNRRLTVNGTLTVSSGTINLNGNLSVPSGGTFNQSGGNINIDVNSNSGATSVASGTASFQLNSNLGTVNGGTITIIDPNFNASGKAFDYNISSAHLTWEPPHTLVIGDGISTDASSNVNGFILENWTSTGRLMFGNLTINGGNGTNRWTSLGEWSINVKGTLTVNANSTLRLNSASTVPIIAGNIVNNGTLVSISNITFASLSGSTVIVNTAAQTISGSGTFANALSSPTASFTGLTINNSAGVTFDANLSVNAAVTINASCIMNVAADRSFNMRTNSLTNNGTLAVEAGGRFVQGTGSTLSGTGTYTIRRNSGNTSNLRYNMWSSPNSVSTLSTLGGSDWYEFNTASNAWSNSGLSGSTSMTVGKGYASTGAGNVLFTGTFNNGNLTSAVDATGNGFNLVGNPYPSTINARIFLDSNTNLNGTLYFWSQPNNATVGSSGGDYASWTTLGGTAGSVGGATPDSNIGVAQGFFVKANSGSTIRFFNSMRSTNVGSNFRVGTAEKAWFNITNNQGLFNQILLGFSPDASDSTDRMDAVKMKGNADISFYSVLNNEHLSIQAMAPRNNTTRIVPLGFDVAAAGAYSIALDRTEALGNEVDIYVKDLDRGTMHNLRTQAYNFSVGQAGTHTNRLQIHFGPALSTSVSNATNTEQVHIYSAGQTIYMQGFKEGTTVERFEVQDAAGRLVLNMSRPQASDLSSVQLSVAPGIYLARIVTNNGTKTQRIYLSK